MHTIRTGCVVEAKPKVVRRVRRSSTAHTCESRKIFVFSVGLWVVAPQTFRPDMATFQRPIETTLFRDWVGRFGDISSEAHHDSPDGARVT